MIKNPPEILIEEVNTAVAANNYEKLWGTNPPPKHNNPPAAVKPEIALVTDIRGVCKAGVTDQTD